MKLSTLPATLAMGAVHLTVTDLDRSIDYYSTGLGLSVRAREAGAARLGAGGGDLLVLTGDRAAPRADRATGLYHVALLVPSRRDLGGVLRHLVDSHARLDGASDHGVSEALYLTDPDGNGLEIYRDRPRAEWPRAANGGIQMVTDPLDVDGVLAEGGSPGGRWPGMPDGTRVGHVHLRVSHIDAAEQFYVGVLGFDLVQRYGRGALFVSAGGYHHHVGLNTWGGVGAPPPPQGAVGLRHADVRLPDAESLAQLVERLRDAGHPVRESPEGVEATDPSGNRLRFVTGHEPTPRA